MAKKKVYFQPQLQADSQELEADLMTIVTSGPDNPSLKPDLENNQKRWLIVGICLHSKIAPVLRTFIEPYVERQYNYLKQTRRINNQTFPMIMDGIGHINFNYGAINNNAAKTKFRKQYNCDVKSRVDFSKLFLATNMTHYTAFDESIDLSALLGLMINIDGIQQTSKTSADQMRSEVRNTWAHCNFNEWDDIQYLSSFQKMHSFIKNLNLPRSEEVELLAELTKWEKNGFKFLQGYVLGEEIIKEIRRQTNLLIKYSLQMKSRTEENFSQVHSSLVQIEEKITIACKHVEEIKRSHEQHGETISVLNEDVDKIRGTITGLENIQKTHGEQLLTTSAELKVMSQDFRQFRMYMSHSKPSGKPLFFPPNRTESFIGREDELLLLKEKFVVKYSVQYTQVICGLGGCGKTTLSIEFAWRFQEMYPGGVFWMSAESSRTLDHSVTALAIYVGITSDDKYEKFQKTLKWLSDLTEPWLLVVDNADEEIFSENTLELIHLKSQWKLESKGHIIITTRREENHVENTMSMKNEDIICLYTLNHDEGAIFLRKRTGVQTSAEDDEDIETIVQELGGLPLALEQAAAHIKSIKTCTFGEYIRLFKKKRLKMLKAIPLLRHMSKERMTIKTTWQLNIDYICDESAGEGLGSAAKTIMYIASFLFADDIPACLINIGNPRVDDDDLVSEFEDQEDNSMGRKQIIEILTRFSLFNSYRNETLYVHRLVQEVVRDSLDDQNAASIIKKGSRMINYVLDRIDTPYTMLHMDNKRLDQTRGALIMWSKIAANADVLREHLFRLAKHVKSESELCFNAETVNILQTSAIFHSLHQRQDQALADQERMTRIIPSLDLGEEAYRKLTAVTIPLQHKDRKTIQECMISVIDDEKENSKLEEGIKPFDSDILRLKGNEALNKAKYQDALQYYTEGIRAGQDNTILCKILANRSQLYIRIGQYENALDDANKCIDIDSKHLNAYILKARAISELIEHGLLPPTWKGVGLASESVASHMQKQDGSLPRLKIRYPLINYILVDPLNLQKEMYSETMKPFTTFILQKGRYDFNVFPTKNSFQVIGIEEGVEIDIGILFQITRPFTDDMQVDSQIEPKIHVHFENVFFVKEGLQVLVGGNACATFYRCNFSNSPRGCDDYPKCKGGKGCIDPPVCITACEAKTFDPMGSSPTGQIGVAGICAKDGSKIYLHSCVLERCGGGGVLSHGDGSLIEITNCTITNMRQTGIEARNGGAIKACNNRIAENQGHGVAIGPRGFGYLACNTIQGNGQEGIWCGGIAEEESKGGNQMTTIMNSKGRSNATIIDNVIYQNGLSGISFDGGCYNVRGNKIFENWLWGMMIKSRSSSYLLNNKIFENKVGGVRVGANYSASVLMDGNTVQDHTGPGLHAISVRLPRKIKSTSKFPGLVSEEETLPYTRPVIKTSTNIFRNNKKDFQHPKSLVDFIQTCCYCHEMSYSLMKCGKCKKATYCSKDCQIKHWKRHKHICKLLKESYIVEINMAKTYPFDIDSGKNNTCIRTFNPKLKGIMKGSPPDRFSKKRFIVKIQSGKEYSFYDPDTEMVMYDQTLTLDVWFSHPVIYHLANECGLLAGNEFTTKKIFCWASFKDKGKTLCIYTDNLPPFKSW